MGKQVSALDDEHIAFIQAQKLFFVATAPEQGRINLSPKGMDSFRVVDRTNIAWLNVTGSGNETASHVAENGRMTVMFCAFEGNPVILRLYGSARVVHPRDSDWAGLFSRFTSLPGARQIFVLNVELVQSSCGMAVPLFDYAADRELLKDWAIKKGDVGLYEYWRDHNQVSLDGKPISILAPIADQDGG